jgi:uncharacterized UPF0160 family protein
MRIVTHNLTFHADDVFACVVLKQVFPKAEIVRTRDKETLESVETNILVDVGGKYDGERFFDHHFMGAPKREDGITYSGFGMIWKKWGQEFLKGYTYAIEKVWKKIDDTLVSWVDAVDNGEEKARGMSVNHLVSAFNPPWNSKGEFDDRFNKAMEFSLGILEREIRSAVAELESEQLVLSASKKLDGNLLVMAQGGPWQKAVFENNISALFVAYQAEDGKSYYLQCVPDTLGGFGKRLELPEAWAGLNDKQLQEVTGVQDAIFCHRGRFIAGAKSLDGVIEMAKIAIELKRKE